MAASVCRLPSPGWATISKKRCPAGCRRFDNIEHFRRSLNSSETTTIRIGIIGAGKIVEDAHLPILKTQPGVHVAWITDQSPVRRQLMQTMYGVNTIAPDDALTSLAEVDVCLIAIPLGARQPYLDACAQNGVAMYVEKPFACTASQHTENLSRFRDHAVAVGFQRRTYNTVRSLRRIIEAQLFGQLQSVQLTLATFTLSSGGAASFRSSATNAGGGITIESAIHHLDQILYATSATGVTTTEVSGIVRDGIDYQVSISSQVSLDDHPDVSVQAFLSCLENRPECCEFKFEHATVQLPGNPSSPLVVSDHRSAQTRYLLEPEAFNQSTGMSAQSVNQAFVIFWDSFLQGLAEESANFTCAADSTLTTQWIEQIYQRLNANDDA